MTYAIRLVSNPYRYGTGDSVYFYDSQENFEYSRDVLQSSNKLPDLSNEELWASGFPGYNFIEMKCYKVEEID